MELVINKLPSTIHQSIQADVESVLFWSQNATSQSVVPGRDKRTLDIKDDGYLVVLTCSYSNSNKYWRGSTSSSYFLTHHLSADLANYRDISHNNSRTSSVSHFLLLLADLSEDRPCQLLMVLVVRGSPHWSPDGIYLITLKVSMWAPLY